MPQAGLTNCNQLGGGAYGRWLDIVWEVGAPLWWLDVVKRQGTERVGFYDVGIIELVVMIVRL